MLVFDHDVSNLDLPVTVLSHVTTSPTDVILERKTSRDSSDTPSRMPRNGLKLSHQLTHGGSRKQASPKKTTKKVQD